jgi:predicted Zn-dependent protease
VTLWEKMSANNQNAPPEWMSTHPSGNSRIQEMQANMNKVLPLYQRAKTP